MSRRTGWLAAFGAELAYFSGVARLLERSRGGAGVILHFERVCPPRSQAFQPLRSREVTPQFLHRVISYLKRSRLDIVSMDEVGQRAVAPRTARRFVALTFDGGVAGRDFIDFAYPLLAAHEVPFTVYLPTAFADGLGEIWWLALEAAIATHDRISLVIDERHRHFETHDVADKMQAYHYIDGWMRTLPPYQLMVAIDDLCRRYGVDRTALSRANSLSWDDIAAMTSNPRACVGTSTVDGNILSNLDANTAQRAVAMGRAVAHAALPYDPWHFAYPSGDTGSFDQRHIAMVGAAGFATAVTCIPGVVQPDGRSNVLALPRLTWDGRRNSMHGFKVMLAGG